MNFKIITAVEEEPVSVESRDNGGMVPNFSGIYEIRCSVTGKVYVGSAVWIAKRWRSHRKDLRAGSHHSSLLQRAWSKYGEPSFVFSVLARCEAHELIATEQLFIDQMKAADKLHGFNINPRAGSALGTKHSAETRAKISAARSGKPLSPAHRAAIGERMQGNQHLRGHVHGPATLEKIAEASRKNYQRNAKHLVYAKSPEQRAEVSERFRGRPLLDVHRAKIAAARKGHVNTPEQLAKFAKSRRVLSDEQLALMRELHAAGVMQVTIAAQFGCSKQTICNALRGRGYGA